MNWIRSLSLILFCLILYTLTASANREEREAQWENGMIHIPRKTSFLEGESTGKLIVSAALEDIESLVINREKKQFLLLQKEKNPLELERILQPSLPWDRPEDQFDLFVQAHTFFLKQLSDGSYKVELQ
ncbi:MAG: hypothetical protein KBD63_07900 [Bacteriovoracaceae bacterium]|nr:hypothetical protein [Bacteriovoracaceae bacterium]